MVQNILESEFSLALDQLQCDLLLSLMVAHDSHTMSWNCWLSCIVIGCWPTASCLSRADLLGGAGSSGAAGFSGAPRMDAIIHTLV